MNGLNYVSFDFCDFTDICLNCDFKVISLIFMIAYAGCDYFPTTIGIMLIRKIILKSQFRQWDSSDNYDAALASYGTRHPRLTGRDTRVLCDATPASYATRHKSRNELIN